MEEAEGANEVGAALKGGREGLGQRRSLHWTYVPPDILSAHPGPHALGWEVTTEPTAGTEQGGQRSGVEKRGGKVPGAVTVAGLIWGESWYRWPLGLMLFLGTHAISMSNEASVAALQGCSGLTGQLR